MSRFSGIPRSPVLLLTVLTAGFFSGLLGVGGGILLVPAFIYFGSVKPKTAHGTSLSSVAVLALAGLAGYIFDNSVHYLGGLFLVGGSLAGVWAGTKLLNQIDVKKLKLVFALLGLVSGVGLLLRADPSDSQVKLTVFLIAGCILLGMIGGFLSGLLGVGGGIVLVPGLIIIFEFAGSEARGTSLLAILFTASAGSVQNYKFQNLNLRLGLETGLIGAAMSLTGALVSVHLPERVIAVLFAILLFVVAGKMMLEVIRGQNPKTNPAAS